MTSRHRQLRAKVLSVVFFCVLVSLVSICHAEEFPSRGIDIIVPYAPGGGVDNFFRFIKEPLAKELKVPVSIVNRGGGGGVVGTSALANAKPDGYTLLGTEVLSFLMYQIINPKGVPFQVLRDFSQISHCAYEPSLLLVKPALGIKTVEELVSYAKQNPGKLLWGTSGLGTQNRLNLELFKLATGTNIRFMSFAGGGEVITNLLGGHIDVSTATLITSRPHVRAGKLIPIAVLAPERLPELPGIPTSKEKGLPDLNLGMNYFVGAPKGLAPEIAEKVSRAMNAALTSPEVRANLERRGYVVQYLSPSQLDEHMKKLFGYYTGLAKKAGVVKD